MNEERKTWGMTDSEIENALQSIDACVVENHPIRADDGHKAFFAALDTGLEYAKNPECFKAIKI